VRDGLSLRMGRVRIAYVAAAAERAAGREPTASPAVTESRLQAKLACDVRAPMLTNGTP
jgi:hypothetical protein